MNLCHKCRKQKPAPGKKFCFECLEIIKDRNHRCYNPEYYKERQSLRREIYKQKKEAGICVRCRKPATHGLYCYEHSIEAKRRNRHRAEVRKEERHARGLIPDYRKENGLCFFCGKPIEPDNLKRGFLVCQRHRELASENSKKAINNPIRLAIKADIESAKRKW